MQHAVPPLKSTFFPCLMNPLTVLLTGMPLPTVMRNVERVLEGFEMPFVRNHFAYKVDAVFPSGFAQFTIRLWSAATPAEEDAGSDIARYYVEVMRTVGERVMVIRFFDKLKMALESVTDAAMAEIIDTLNSSMLDWAPATISHEAEEDDATFDVSTEDDDVANGGEAMLMMLSSPYDDVVADGCSAVAKLAVSYKSSRSCMAASPTLVKALLLVVLSDDSAKSCLTRTNAALALQELTVLPVGQKSFWAVCTSSLLHAFLAEASTRVPERTYSEWLLQRYCMATLANCCNSSAGEDVKTLLRDTFINGGTASYYSPIMIEAARGLRAL